MREADTDKKHTTNPPMAAWHVAAVSVLAGLTVNNLFGGLGSVIAMPILWLLSSPLILKKVGFLSEEKQDYANRSSIVLGFLAGNIFSILMAANAAGKPASDSPSNLDASPSNLA